MIYAVNYPVDNIVSCAFICHRKLTIRLVKRTAQAVIDAARPTKMDGWASSAAQQLDNPELPFFAIECSDEGIIGQAGLHLFGGAMAGATIALFNPKHRNRGIGTLVIRMLCAYAFLSLGLGRISLRVNQSNKAALRCYYKAGFVIVKANKDGSMLMEAQREFWLAIHGADAPKLADSISSWVDVV